MPLFHSLGKMANDLHANKLNPTLDTAHILGFCKVDAIQKLLDKTA